MIIPSIYYCRIWFSPMFLLNFQWSDSTKVAVNIKFSHRWIWITYPMITLFSPMAILSTNWRQSILNSIPSPYQIFSSKRILFFLETACYKSYSKLQQKYRLGISIQWLFHPTQHTLYHWSSCYHPNNYFYSCQFRIYSFPRDLISMKRNFVQPNHPRQ